MDEFPTYDDFKEIKDKYDELKQLCLTLQREKNLFEESYGDVSARLVEAQEDCDMYKDLYNGFNVKNGKLIKEMDRFISENAKLKDENKTLTETLDKLRTQSLEEVTTENSMIKDELEKTKEKLKEMIGQRDNLYGAYNDISEKLKETENKYEDLVRDFQDLKAKHQSASESCERLCNDCRKLREENRGLAKGMDKFISENVKLKEDYNKLVDENKMLTETLDKLRTKKPDDCENKWATIEEAKEFIDSIQRAPLKLDLVLPKTPSVVINTKSINITFDNHTNNFKEDDTND